MKHFLPVTSSNHDPCQYVQLVVPGPIGGLEKVLFTGLNQLQKQNVKCPVWIIRETRVPELTYRFSQELKDLNISFKIFDCRGKFDFKLLKKLKNEIDASKPKIIHAHGFKAVLYAHLIRKNIKFVITHHGVTAHTMQVRCYEFVERQIMRKADRVVAVSEFMRDQLSNHRVDSAKISIIENPLSINKSLINRTPRANNRLLYVGRLSPEKACGNLIKAVQRLDVFVDIVGDGAEKDELIQLTQKLHLEDKIKFHGFHKNINKYLNECSFLVMPSLTEGFPLTAIEAVCFGVPIIASNVGALSKLVSDNGKLVEPGIIASLENAIETSIKDFRSLNDAAKKRSEQFLRNHSAESWADKTNAVYNELTNKL